MNSSSMNENAISGFVTLRLWPQYRVFVDFYKPSVAAPLLRGLYKLDDESARVTVKLWAMDAREEVERTQN